MNPIFQRQRKAHAAIPLAALFFLGAVAALSIALLRPPVAVPESAAPSEFSSGRALRHLREIARAPHPVGSAEHDRVRDYIVGELRALGLNPEIQATTVVRKSRAPGGLAVAARAQNIVARLDGTAHTKALMLAAHYDSVPTARGATDDGAGVVTLLETLRALKSGPPLKNDLIFLFTDAEELGLLGAHAFADEHPWMRDVGVVLNIEGRGNSGPSMMFETSAGNGLLIRELASAAPHVIASSLMYAVYERMPNDTDMTVFKGGGAAGLNFAYSREITHYHTMLDGPEETDERSVQHHGSYALTLARRFGELDLRHTTERDAVYFNPLGTLFVHYSEAWVWPLTMLVTMAFIFTLFVGVKDKRLTLKGMALGFAALFVACVGAGALTTGAWRLARLLDAGIAFLPWGAPYNMWLYEIGFALLSIAISAMVYAFFARRASALDLLAGAQTWWLLLLLLTTALIPPATFLYAWPLLFSIAGLAFVVSIESGNDASLKSVVALTLCAAPAVVLLTPTIYLSFVMLGLGLAGFFMLLTVFALGLCAPLLISLTAPNRRALTGALALAGVIFVGAGIATGGFDSERRKVNSLFYVLNADTQEARWASADARLDDWTAQFISTGASRESLASIFPWSRQQAWQGRAPALPLPAPHAEVIADNMRDDVREVRLRLSSPRRAPTLLVFLEPETEILSATLDGKPLIANGDTASGGAGNPLRFLFAATPPEGIELTLEARGARPLKLTAQDVSHQLPDFPEQTYSLRPPDSMPSPSGSFSDTTVVSKTFVFERR